MEITPEIMRFAELAVERAIQKVAKSPVRVREVSYAINAPEIYESFPDLAPGTLKKWVYGKKIGQKCADNKYRVKLSEIEKYLFKR